jgi:hypothetical protein
MNELALAWGSQDGGDLLMAGKVFAFPVSFYWLNEKGDSEIRLF